MASMTAHILVGQPDPYHGGIYPTHTLWLSENGRSGWLLEPTGRGLTGGPNSELEDEESPSWTRESSVWIPSAEHMLEDAILLIAVHVLRDEAVLELVRERAPALTEMRTPFQDKPVELYGIPEDVQAELRARCELIDNYKLVVTVLEGSSLEQQLPVLEQYAMGVEVCTVTYSALRRGMGGTGPVELRGSLMPGPTAAGSAQPTSRPDRTPLERALVGPAGEHYVLFRLYQQVILASLAPPGSPTVDVLALSPDETVIASLQVKTRTYGRDRGWHMRDKHEEIAEERYFYAFVDFEPDIPVTYIIPSRVVADVLKKAHQVWLDTPGARGQPHKDGPTRRLVPDYRYDVPGYPAEWLDEYKERWELLKAAVD